MRVSVTEHTQAEIAGGGGGGEIGRGAEGERGLPSGHAETREVRLEVLAKSNDSSLDPVLYASP
jgi:hypothetical protein